MMEPAGPADPAPRAFLRVGGATIARHHLVLALQAGCERVICLARSLGPELLELQHETEKAGASFHVIAGPRGLSGLVNAADEVLAITEGLLPTAGDALRLLSGPGVLVQPSETGVPAGYERIDLNHAAAGLMLVPGRLVERLMELPPDVDPGSALMRIALQAGVAQRPVPDDVRSGGRWLLVRSEEDAHAAEEGWMTRHTAGGGRTPGPWLVRILVRKLGPALLHAEGSNLAVAGISVVLASMGLAAAWFGLGATGLLLAGAGWLSGRVWTRLDGLRREALAQHGGPAWRAGALDLAFDAALIVMLTLLLPALAEQPLLERAFAPIMLVGLLRLLGRGFPEGWSAWANDRLVLVLVLAALVLGGVVWPGVPALAALFLLAALVLPREAAAGAAELTRA